MCGILAILSNNRKNIVQILESFNELQNRGPDSGSLVIRNEDILGFRRLAIVDQSIKGEQPFSTDKSRLLCNGEIYNHKELREKNFIKCSSTSDCECIIHLHEMYGFKKMLSKLHGVYAIILISDDIVYFARDPIGVRPLFYGFTESGDFTLGSYARLLTNFCTNVTQLKPGWGQYNLREKTLELYPDIKILETISVIPDLTIIKNTLINSVKYRLMSERPIGCLLSGGLDSSLITSILCHLVGPSNVRTYSVGIKGSEDLKYAKRVSDYLGTNHTEILFTPEQGCAVIEDVIKDLESYDITTIRASIPMWLLAKYISTNTKDIVLMSGEGADELFCGYLYFHYAPNSKELEKESKRLVQQLYLYDVLRADRCVSSHGLELRVPFLDKKVVNLALSIHGKFKQPRYEIEKYLLRVAFKDDWLPEEVLWRRKDGMSDGVSGNKNKKWFEEIQDFVNTKITNQEFKIHKDKFPSKEAYYYKKVYNKLFPSYQPVYNYWLPKWIECNGDPSGRILPVFK